MRKLVVLCLIFSTLCGCGAREVDFTNLSSSVSVVGCNTEKGVNRVSYYKITSKDLVIKENCTDSSKDIGMVSEGIKVHVIEDVGSWVGIEFNGSVGYVLDEYLVGTYNSSEPYRHTVDTSGIKSANKTYNLYANAFPCFDTVLDYINQGNKVIPESMYGGNEEGYREALAAIMHGYLGLSYYDDYVMYNGYSIKYGENCLWVNNKGLSLAKERLHDNELRTDLYKNYLYDILSSLNLNTTDEDLVNQINNYIVDMYLYEKIEEDMATSIEIGKGRCSHYSTLFKDMCNSVGIESYYQSGYSSDGDKHAWNYVVIDGNKYYFDVTWNDTYNTDYWTWLSEEDMRKDHSW